MGDYGLSPLPPLKALLRPGAPTPSPKAFVRARLLLRNLSLPTCSAHPSSTFLSRSRLTDRVFRFYSLRTEFYFSSPGVNVRSAMRLNCRVSFQRRSPAFPRAMRSARDANRTGAFNNSWAMCPIMMRSSAIPVGLFQRIRRFPVFLAAHYHSISKSRENSSAFRGFSQERF